MAASSGRLRCLRLVSRWLLPLAVVLPSHAATVVAQLGDLTLEQLRDVRVVTVSRFEEQLDATAASVYVITADEIRRSGASTIGEALRLAPLLDVARADASQYAISARGFNNVLANKMLVLIDGRAVYTPLFSGVFWEAQDVALGDVDRIEVVSGPSTALWGTNAVNGLIHIITKPATETLGARVAVEAGNRQRSGEVRFGTRAAGGAVRLYAKGYDRDDTHRANGTSVIDQAEGVQAGFRADWSGPLQRLTLQGDTYRGSIDQLPTGRTFSGANLLARVERTTTEGNIFTFQAFLDHTRREQLPLFRESLDTLDLATQYGFNPSRAHSVLIGAGYRRSNDDVTTSTALTFRPAKRVLEWSRLFAQDRVLLRPDLDATLAASLEHNPYTGLEVLPSVRLGWRMSPGRLAWAAISRAVRAPSRIDREFFQPSQPPHALAGGPDFKSEVSNVAELGYRDQVTAGLAYSATAFYHQHRKLRSVALTSDGPQFRNDIEGSTRGLEAWARWRINRSWRLDGGLVVQSQHLRVREGATDLGGLLSLGNDPRYWASMRSALDVSPTVSWDVAVRHVGERSQPKVPSYTALDTRLAWRAHSRLELALQVSNALNDRHPEWGPASNRVELERAVSAQARWSY
jgi:iron complex outermembrane receptor protein